MTLGSHQQTVGKSQAHFTPRWILDALGPFDLDPCAGLPRPWDCAKVNLSSMGLDVPWRGRVWLNPPFDRYQVGTWVQRLADHEDGIALLHARTEAGWFEPIWHRASAILFLGDRLKFCDAHGNPQRANSGAPAVLCAFDGEHTRANANALTNSNIPGFIVYQWSELAA